MTSWLHEQRLKATCEVVRHRRSGTVADLGCGNGDLLTRLAAEPQIDRIVGVDLRPDSLRRLREQLARLDNLQANVDLIHGCLIDVGRELTGFDCAVLVETIEHLDPARLSSLETAVFAEMRPKVIVVTTPNAEFNSLLGVPTTRFRHPDHRFEWDRPRFQRWAQGVAARNGYAVAFQDLAGRHPALGGASQMALFDIAAARLVV
jgi:3' terminal RNA ribose 2'-O-methyltransferase Hen1